MKAMFRPTHIVGLGGSLQADTTNERAVKAILSEAARLGSTTTLFSGADLDMPHYDPGSGERSPKAARLVSELLRADAIVLGSPAYHGGVSGLIKNAIDYAEDLRDADRRYFEERPVACVATGGGWQGAAATLSALRAIVHALRGWPIPLGIIINSRDAAVIDAAPRLPDDLVRSLESAAAQLLEFIRDNPVRPPQPLDPQMGLTHTPVVGWRTPSTSGTYHDQ